ncbi:MAG: metallophosphoesterase, partial [Huintestinicola sp.]
HGGQWRVPFLINGVYAPEQGLFPKYAGGMYEATDGIMIVSRGLSRTNDIIPRIFNNPELVIIDILPEGEVEN